VISKKLLFKKYIFLIKQSNIHSREKQQNVNVLVNREDIRRSRRRPKPWMVVSRDERRSSPRRELEERKRGANNVCVYITRLGVSTKKMVTVTPGDSWLIPQHCEHSVGHGGWTCIQLPRRDQACCRPCAGVRKHPGGGVTWVE